MPTIDVHLDILNQIIGRKLEDKELEKLLSTAKAELEQKDLKNRIVRVELKDTNRPDLWSTVGLGRHLRRYIGEKKSIDYKFFSNSSCVILLVSSKWSSIVSSIFETLLLR